MLILTLRPADKASRDAARWRAAGFDVLAAPMLAIVPMVDWPARLPQGLVDRPPAALLATSAAAFAAGLPPALAALPVLCVGASTAAAARAAGCVVVESADGDVAALAALARRRIRTDADGAAASSLLYLAGRDRTGDLAGDLTRAGLAVTTVETYAAEMAETLPAPVVAALAAGAVDVVVVASARTARAFAAGLVRAGLADRLAGLTVAAISAAAAAPLAGAGRILTAATPDGESLDRLVVALGAAVPNNGAWTEPDAGPGTSGGAAG
ncbi:uroporphyrinogen-III synthase [Methylobrevis albus]|uniref:Uroporphyrinogen-III synthase n=1 Tax=Methylobrevis albus TaxID=2793297 RepID=A0A931I2Y3_9HYPH|nr:uroporphyrinogen-III synthase [Methylobrevis albus]MBH0237913.1 uroporphyrinogen-III synthase [Methylobrevis albus]